MKSAKFWSSALSSHNFDSRTKIIEQIQLDAMKEGARRAAELMKQRASIYRGAYLNTNDVFYDARHTILTTAEQWTEKDL